MKDEHIQLQLSALAPVTLTPVGIIRSEIREPILKATDDGLSLEEHNRNVEAHHHEIKTLVSEVIIHPDLSGILDGIEGFSHILILYWPHLVAPERRSLIKVHPMGRKDIPKQGIFATCSPARPNPVLITAVKLVERENNILWVQGLEAVDGSPVLDIKPYNPGYYRVEAPLIPDWLRRIQQD